LCARALVERERSLFNVDATVYLCDLTSTYFEGQCVRNAKAKAKRGYSRDHRPDCKQVVVGLVVSREGFPITHGVCWKCPGPQDRTTLASMLDRLTESAGLKPRSTEVVDRGMAYAPILARSLRRWQLIPLAVRRAHAASRGGERRQIVDRQTP
jgi:hypothetical protein